MNKMVLVGSDDNNSLFMLLEELQETMKSKWEIKSIGSNLIDITYYDDSNINLKYLIINIDLHAKFDLSAYEGYKVITVGFNKKASVTVSSVEDEEIVFCIQREIDLSSQIIEPQEFVMKGALFSRGDTLNGIFAFTTLLLSKEYNTSQYTTISN
ncbi:MAG: hypothetical protein CVU84_11745 [Firmicutes bacterium HGW-Firmicutes-1]|jgi:hypothetical protein|nr:MAG: hypothetical protein CVU84_11745 [Firmicutes bacterium HGW-Firmicutes-1]